MSRYLMTASALIWAGLSLGGNLIVAPAKFQVADLTMPVALQVGRAQFTWIGYAEWVFLGIILLSALVLRTKTAIAFLAPAAIFLAQQFVAMPMLNARSDVVIAGGIPPESNLHNIYILLELAKFLMLVAIGLILIAKGDRA